MKITENALANLVSFVESHEVIYQTAGDIVDVSDDKHPKSKKYLLEEMENVAELQLYAQDDAFVKENFYDLYAYAKKIHCFVFMPEIETILCLNIADALEAGIVEE